MIPPTFTERQCSMNRKSHYRAFSLTDAIPFHGDSLNAKLGWRSGHKLTELSGQNVRLRFHLLGGDLYSFGME